MIDRFAWPWAFLLLLLPVGLLILGSLRSPPGISLPGAATPGLVRRNWRTRLAWLPSALRFLGLCGLIVAIARPQETKGTVETSTSGVAINLVVDRSLSMSAPMEFDGDRLQRIEAVKRVLGEFVLGNGTDLAGRPADLVGLIVFAGFADTVCPLVRSHDTLVSLANATQLAPGTRPEGGTNIGDALALAAARLKRAEEDMEKAARANPDPRRESDFVLKSKCVVLLTDGENNTGSIHPLDAARAAAEWGVKVYCIGIGGDAPLGAFASPFEMAIAGNGVDEALLREIAQITDGKYWLVESADSLREVYSEIDRLEKTDIRSHRTTEYLERFQPFAAAAGALLAVELLLAFSFLRRVP